MNARIECPKCGKETVVNKDGKVRLHAKKMQKRINGESRRYCDASGKAYKKLTTKLMALPKPQKRLRHTILSARQMQVLDLIVKGFSHKETGYILNISHRTVDNHVAKIKSLLKINDRYELLRWGKKNINN